MKLRSTRDVQQDGLKVLVYGQSGAGKTSLCGTTGGNPLIISAEGGLLSLAEQDLASVEVQSLDELNEVYRYVTESEEANQFDWICLDSISEIGEVVLSNEKKNTKDPRQAYGALMDHMQILIRSFRDLKGKNVYFSCKMERIADQSTGAMLYSPLMPGAKLAQQIPYFFDEVFALHVDKDLATGETHRYLQTSTCPKYLAKDRSGKLDHFIEPNLSLVHSTIYANKAN